MRFAVMVMVAMACGPAPQQVKAAHQAEYKASADEIFELAKTVATENYRLGSESRKAHYFVTAQQFYSAEGSRQSTGADDVVRVTPGSIQLRLKVQVTDAGLHRVNVAITPIVFQIVKGSPQPRELTLGDPNMPPWVAGRVDALAVAIYERAKHLIEKP
jgi:hypothetical protein